MIAVAPVLSGVVSASPPGTSRNPNCGSSDPSGFNRWKLVCPETHGRGTTVRPAAPADSFTRPKMSLTKSQSISPSRMLVETRSAGMVNQ